MNIFCDYTPFDKPSPYQFNTVTDRAECAAVKVVGARMRDGRLLCGVCPTTPLGVAKAAKLLGVKARYLEDLEKAVNVESVPLWLIVKAAKVYSVTTDFLLGLVSDWEDDPSIKFERDFSFIAYEQHQEDFSKMMVGFIRQQNQMSVLLSIIEEISSAINDVSETVLRFQELNARFPEMPCGSQLLHRTRVLVRRANEAKNRSTKCKLIPYKSEIE